MDKQEEENFKSENPNLGLKKKKSVGWDTKTFEEKEEEKQIHPKSNIVTEPTTTNIPNEGNEEKLKELDELNNISNSNDAIVSSDKEKTKRKSSCSSEEFIEIEIIEADGSVLKKRVKKDKEIKKDFDEKRHKSYKNEFTEAKRYFEEHKGDNDIVQATLNNTIKNKFIGKTINEEKKE